MSTTELLYAAAVPFFFGLMALEAWAARRRGRVLYERADTLANLAMGLGNRIIELGWVLLQVAALGWLHRTSPLDLGGGPWAWVVALVAVDFWFYWYHRMHHEVRLLWASHVVHHSSRRYNLAVALRQPWLVCTLLPFLAPVALLGVGPELIATSYAVNLFYQFWIHTQLVDRLPGWFEAVCNTPSHHRVHHGSNPRYLDRNYGGVLIVWDRLFGTFQAEDEPVVYGLTTNIDTSNPLRIATHELVDIATDVHRARRWRDKASHLLRGPGWRPEPHEDSDVATVTA